MADYYVDASGNISKKKKKSDVAYIVDASGNITAVKDDDEKDEDIAPVKKTEEKERSWFQAGAFEDGYQLGDVFKSVIGTASDIGTGILEGAGKTAEGVFDAGAYLLAGGADLVGADSFADDVRKVAQKDEVGALFESIRENNPNDDYSLLGEKSRGVTNALGQILTVIGTGGAGAAAGLGKIGTTLLTSGFMGVSSAGAGTSEAYAGGATDAEAAVYGVSKGAIDAVSEMIFGGLGKAVKATGLSHGLSSIDDMAAKALSDKITSRITSETVKRVAGNVAEYGVKASAEGLEEVIAGVGTIAAKKLTYMSEEDIMKIYEDENLLEQFIVGAVTSGIAQAPDLISSTKADTDFVTGRTSNEEAVVKKEVENRIADEEADGKKLTLKEKLKIEEQVERDLEKGYISTDTIEEVLGGETYKEYKSTMDSEDSLVKEEASLREEFDTLNRMKQGDMTGEQVDRREELRAQLTDISAKIGDKDAKAKRDELKTRLSDEVSAMVRGDRLSESYNERGRRREAFTADVEKYTGTQRKVVEAAVKSGILNNTNRTHEFVEVIAKISADKGVLFDFTNNDKLKESGFALEGAVTNGYTSKDGIVLNMDSGKAWQTTVGHEVAHVLEGTELYGELQTALFDYAKSKGEYDSRLQSVTELYKKYDPEADPKAELTADLVGEYLFTDADFVSNLSVNHRNVFQKIFDEIKYLAKVVTAGSKEARQIEKIKRAFERAYREGGAVGGNTHYSLFLSEEDIPDYLKAGTRQNKNRQARYEEGQQMVISSDADFEAFVKESIDGKRNVMVAYGKVEENLAQQVKEKSDSMIDVSGAYLELLSDDIHHAYREHEHAKEPGDLDMAVDELIYALRNVNQSEVVSARQFKDGAQRVTLAVPTEDGMMLLVEVASKSSGTLRLKTGWKTTNEKFAQKYRSSSSSTGSVNSTNTVREDTASGNSITENSEKSSGNAKKSLSPEQEEYFKDSVVRDEDGNLKVMYHGTSAGGHTVFDPYGKANYGLFGAGSYFTDNPEVAQSYTKKGRGTSPQVYETYLNIKNPIDMDAPADAAAWAEAMPDVDFPESGTNEDFYRAMEEYFEDMEYPRWEAAETAMGVIEGMGFDGITHIGGGRVDADGVRHRVYIAFQSEQIKAVDNLHPTANADIHRSISADGAASSRRGVPLRDLRLETEEAPVQEDIAPVADAPVNNVVNNTVNDSVNTADVDYAPYSEAVADRMRDEGLAGIRDTDAPPEMDAPFYDEEGERAEPDDPFETRDMKDVGSRSVKAYMYENPEVKPFFQAEANVMLGELSRTVKGEKTYTEGDFGGYGAESNYQWTGTKRHTSDDIAYLRDSLNYSYAEIEKGLKAIIEDDGKENNAASKRIEFLLNDRLLKGYRDMDTGDEYPPNEGYVRLLQDKEILEYSEEARARFFENADAYAPPVEEADDIAPVREDVQTVQEEAPTVHNDAPTVGKQVSLEGDTDAEAEPTLTRKSLHESIVGSIKERFAQGGFDLDEVLKKAKDLSTFATVDNTPQRVMEKALGYKQGQILSDATVNKVAQNETEGIRWLNSFTDRQNGLLAQISRQYHIRPGTRKSAAAQMYAEGFYVDGENNIIAYGDAELAADFPNARVQANIKGLAADPRIRQIYDETLEAINASRRRNAYPEIPRLENYFLHFRAMDDTFSRLGLPFNPNDIRAKDLPTDLNGVTADLKPGQPFFASAMHRTGQRTSFDLLGGLEKYLGSAKNQIYHIDDIQTLRALRNYIADTYGQAHGLDNLDALSDEEAEARIHDVYDSHLSTFAKFLNEEANVLAGKTSLVDRGLEGVIGRRGMTTLDTINRQVGANMVGFNISSSMTNFLSVVQAAAKSKKFPLVKAFAQTASNRISSIFGKGDGFAEASPVMIRRKGAESFYRTPWQKAGDAGYFIMSAVDSISTELIARTRYNELTRGGMDSQRAHIETDKWVSRLMGDRSLGQQPQLYNSKMLGLFTKFQLEVRNQLDAQFYDTIQEAKVSTEEIQNGLARNAVKAAKITSTMVQLAVLQHIFGKAFESVAGYNPSFDIIEAIMKTFGWDDEEDDDTWYDNAWEGFLSLLGDLPYTSTFTGGRVPIESALPIEQFLTGKDSYGNEKNRWETLGEAAPYYVLPAGYGQIKKTVQGLSMFSDEHPVSGSYTNSGNLRFPVEDTAANKVQAALFGQWASGNARDYFDNERSPLKEKQIEEFIASGMTIQDYWDYREGLSKHEKLADKADYIDSLDIPLETKNLLINNISDRNTPIDMTDYSMYSDFEEFDFAEKNPEKYAFLRENNITYAEYAAFDEDTKEAWAWAYDNPEGFTLSKAAAADLVTYRKYARELSEIKADKDEDGKSINGSRKDKVAEYLNALDADYGEKIILFKNEYNADDTYNYDIIEYLDSREDISYEEMVTILKKLGFTVSGNNVTW